MESPVIMQWACLDKCVDRHNCQIGLALGIVHQIQINQLLQLQIISLHAIDHIGEQSAVTCHLYNNWFAKAITVTAHLTSLPTVILAMTFLTASRFFSFFSELSSVFSSKISPTIRIVTSNFTSHSYYALIPFLVVVKYLESVMMQC